MKGPAKPREGDPCNGCGVCCMASPCPLADLYVPGAREGAPCPAIVWDGGLARCGLVVAPSAHSPDLALALDLLAGRRGPPEKRRLLEVALGQEIRSILGDGECDSGPGDGGVDQMQGKTAEECVAMWALEAEE